MIQIKKTILTLVALLAVTTGAWADETPLLTIESKDNTTFLSGSKTFDDKVTVTFSNFVYYDGEEGWYADGDPSQLTVAGINGYTITSCKFYTNGGDGTNGYPVEGKSPSVYLSASTEVYTDANQSVYIGYQGVKKIEVYGAAASSATDPNAVTALEIDATVYSGWSSDDGVLLKASELPGFHKITLEQAKTWADVPATGTVLLIYEIVADGDIKVVIFNDGNYSDSYEWTELGRYYIWEDIKYSDNKYFYTTGPASASGPEVAWDKTENSGSFKMPGGNVTLEPEYYPQAALAAAPTAINDVPATTDGAIVNAGTVANIGETTTAQGTVMYHVSQSALSDAALLALAADQWTADVPTAAGLAQGQAYVYYYVRGNDGDTDDEIFSDGDILAANAIQVTIAAEPTYAVTFADGVNPEPPAEPEWTASPNADVKKGQTVTVTYTGSKKVIGVKAEKKAAAGIVNPVVGQIIGSDGKNYDANATLPDGVTAVAKIAYVGNDAETSTTYNHGLALALGDVSDKKAWCSQYQKTCLTTQYGSADAAKGDMAGIANTDALVNHTGHSHAAASAARDYNGGTHPMGTSEWFLPSAGQWDKMASAAGGYVKLRTNAGLQSDYYWSSTERDASYAWYFSSHNGDWLKDYKDMYSHRVRACLAF